MNLRIEALVTLLALLLVGCSSTPSSPTVDTPPTPQPTSLVLTPTPTSVPPSHTATATASPEPTPEPTPTFEPGTVILPTPVMPTPTPTPELDPFVDALNGIDAEVHVLRGLYSLRQVEKRFITRDELASRLSDELEDDRDDLEQTGQLLVTLGILGPEVDFFDLVLSMYSEGVLGFYDPETETLFVVEDKPGLDPLDMVTYAHEFVHALQQQHFDIKELLDSFDENSDAEQAATGLIEGDATLAETLYMFNYLDEEQRSQVVQGQRSIDLKAFSSAPRLFQRLFVFPYREGANFVLSLYREDGWQAVDEAFATPPSSTEQVLHPDKFASGEEPVPVAVPDVSTLLGDTWFQVGQDTLGEFFVLAYLETAVPQGQAALAASGWGGDRYSLVSNADGQTLLIWSISWDTEEDATEFFETFAQFMETYTGGVWQPADDGQSGREMSLPDQVVLATIDLMDTRLIFAPDELTLEAALAALAE